MYNLPEKVLLMLGTIFSLSYATINENEALITNYGPIFILDFIALVMRLYYVTLNCGKRTAVVTSVMIQTDYSPITITVVSLD